MFFEFGRSRRVTRFGQWPHDPVLADARQGNGQGFAGTRHIFRDAEIHPIARRTCRIGKDNDWRLQTLAAVHGHNPHQIGILARFPLQLTIASIEPLDKALQAHRMVGGIGLSRIEEFVDRIVRLAPQSLDQPAPSAPRTDQYPVQQCLHWLVIRQSQEVAQLPCGFGSTQCFAFAQVIPQPNLAITMAIFEQVFLTPPDQRRDQKVGEAEIVERLRSEAQRGQQILHRKRIAQPQAVDTRHRHARRI